MVRLSCELGTIYRAFRYNEDNHPSGNNAGNDLVEETDSRGNKTSYTVNSSNSRRESVTDRVGTKTDYEYDNAGRTTAVTCTQADGTALSTVSYAYDGMDNLTAITRGDGMAYLLSYNAFHQLSDIGIDGKNEKLIRYTYKNGNGRLKQISYANGHTMKATYNSLGQMISEKWYASASAAEAGASPIAAYRYVYNGKGNIVRSLDKICKKEYTYEYEDERVIRATESDVTLSGETVTARSLVSTLRYYYDAEGKMTKKVITPAGGTSQTFYYETRDGNTVVRFSAGGRTVTSHSKTDSFGRKVFDELQLGTDFVSRQFVYHAGKITDEHKEKAKVKSSATTQLVSQIILSNGTTLSYSYDAEERITSVTESYTVAGTSVTNTTLYTYDALGQLLTETVNGEVVNSMEYDNYGNITKKNGKTYTYGNTVWKDLLTKVGTGENTDIVYDAQGNPTQYLGHTLTWEKGRQLKSFDSNTYTYNANGIRTSKTVNGVKHTYTLDGAKILREAWDGNTLVPLYDNEDSVCGILYNDNPYYFAKNQQGDIIAILDKDAQTVARYSYDAWGVCTNATTYTDLTNGIDIATVNPFRYRGYYYDKETSLYYLQSRYYDAGAGRFVNADAPKCIGISISPISLDLYAYCQNNCANVTDEFGFGTIDSLISALSSAIDIISNILGMFANSYYREQKSLEDSVKLLTKRQRNRLNDIRSLNKEVNRVCKYLKWVGYALLLVSLAVILGKAYRTGASMDRAIVDCIAETIINLVVQGAGNLFSRIARFIPYIGFLIGVIGGWLLSYALRKLFNSQKIQRVKNKFANSIKNIRTRLWNWLKIGMASLTA